MGAGSLRAPRCADSVHVAAFVAARASTVPRGQVAFSPPFCKICGTSSLTAATRYDSDMTTTREAKMVDARRLFVASCLVFALIIACNSQRASAQNFPWPPLENPYCPVATFVNDEIPARGFSTMLPGPAGPIAVIFISTAFVNNAPLLRFAIAHECGHHMTGQIIFHAENPFATLPYAAQEYQADCWAAQTLRARGDIEAIQAALIDAGPMPSLALPMRVPNIRSCAGI
jgi:hypothetical protein